MRGRFKEEDLKKIFNPVKTNGAAFIGHLVVAYVLAGVVSYIGTATLIEY